MQLVELMKEAIFNTLEKMFFTLVEFEGDVESSSYEGEPKECSYIEVKCEGKVITISIELGNSFARTLTADFLGIIKDEVREEDVVDCMKELANMVGGNFIASYKYDKCALGLPKFGNPNLGSGNIEKVPLYVLGERIGTLRVYLSG